MAPLESLIFDLLRERRSGLNIHIRFTGMTAAITTAVRAEKIMRRSQKS